VTRTPDPERLAPPPLFDPAPYLADGAEAALADRRLDAVSWLLSAGLDGPCLVVGAGPHPLGLEIAWPAPVVMHDGDGVPPAPDAPDGYAALVHLPYGPRPDVALLRTLLRQDADIVAVGEPPALDRDWERWAVKPDLMRRARLLPLDDGAAMDAGAGDMRRRWRLLPNFLRRRVTEADLFAWRAPGREPRLTAVLNQVRDHGAADRRRGSLALLQDKGKLTVRLRAADHDAYLKLARTRRAAADLDNGAAVLDRLQHGLPADHPLRPLLPHIVRRCEQDGAPAWLEHGCHGTPLADREDDDALPGLLRRTADLVAGLADLPAAALPDPDPRAAADKLAFLAGLARALGPDVEAACARVLPLLADGDGPWRLRKGDFSLSNVLSEGDRITGLIDWDESGLTRRPLANLADLLFSWLWQKEGLARARSLPLMLGGELPARSGGVDLREWVGRCGGDRRGLALGALESWSDHAYHELKHPRSLGDRGRVDRLFREPLMAAAAALRDGPLEA